MKDETQTVERDESAFEMALRANKPPKAILAVLDAPPSKRRERRIARMESHARVHLMGSSEIGDVDWAEGSIDWKGLFALLLKLLPIILALFP